MHQTTKKLRYNMLQKGFIWLPILFIPLVFTTNTIDANVLIRFVSLSVYLLFVAFFLMLTHRKHKATYFSFIKDKFLYICILYMLFSGFSLIVMHGFVGNGMFEWLKTVLLVMLILLFNLMYADYKAFIIEVSKAITILALIITTYGFCQLYYYAQHHSMPYALYQMNATFANKNIFAEVLIMCLPFSLFMFFAGKKYWNIIGVISSLLLLSLIVIAMCRAVWLALSVATAISFLFALVSSGNARVFISEHLLTKKSLLVSLLCFFVVAASLYIYSQATTEPIFSNRIKSITNIRQGSSHDRIELWEKTLKLCEERPFFGYGMGSFKVEILRYGNKGLDSQDNLLFYQRPHNDYLWIFAEQGIFSLILYLLLFFYAFRYIFIILKTTNERDEKIFFILMSFALTGYLVFSFFSFPKERIEHILFLGLIFSSITICYRKHKHTVKRQSIQSITPVMVAIIIVSIIAITIGSIMLYSEIHLRKAFKWKDRGIWNCEIIELQKINTLFYDIDPFSMPIAWYRGLANFNLNNADAACSDFNDAYRANPYNVYVLDNMAGCCEIAGNHAKALELYGTATKLSPTYDGAALNLCALLFNDGTLDSAIALLRNIDAFVVDTVKYKQYLRVVLHAKINKLMETETNVQLKNYYKELANDSIKPSIMFKASLKNNISLEKQLLQR